MELQKGQDAMVESATGSGKTLSYLIPILDNLAAKKKKLSRCDGTFALILCPTRELCLQVLDVATLLSRRFAWIVPGSIHGGENRSKEKARLRKGLNVLISTPGRLLDHLTNTDAFKIDLLEWIILDEADRLLDLGFKKQISSILKLLQTKSKTLLRWQSALFSATLQGGIEDLAEISLKNPVTLRCRSNEKDKSEGSFLGMFSDIPTQLEQQYMVVPCKLRLAALFATIRQHLLQQTSPKMLVFVSNCDSVDFHHKLTESSWEACFGESESKAPRVFKLHGNMPQIERTKTLVSFTKESAGVLFATDVASRGLDFPQISMIIQYDPPTSAEEYVHRVGRTARFGRTGRALLFAMPAECGFINYMRSTCGLKGLEKVDAAQMMHSVYGLDAKAGSSLPLDMHRGANQATHHLTRAVDQDANQKSLAEVAFLSSVRAYATHSKDLKPFFSMKSLHVGHFANSFALKYVAIEYCFFTLSRDKTKSCVFCTGKNQEI